MGTDSKYVPGRTHPRPAVIRHRSEGRPIELEKDRFRLPGGRSTPRTSRTGRDGPTGASAKAPVGMETSKFTLKQADKIVCHNSGKNQPGLHLVGGEGRIFPGP